MHLNENTPANFMSHNNVISSHYQEYSCRISDFFVASVLHKSHLIRKRWALKVGCRFYEHKMSLRTTLENSIGLALHACKKGLCQIYWHRPQNHSIPAFISATADFTTQQLLSADTTGYRRSTSCPCRRERSHYLSFQDQSQFCQH